MDFDEHLNAIGTVIMDAATMMHTNDNKQNYRNSNYLSIIAAGVVVTLVGNGISGGKLLHAYRNKIEKQTATDWEVVFAFGPFALLWDLQAEFERKNVPRITQIQHGLMDLVITNISRVRNGHA